MIVSRRAIEIPRISATVPVPRRQDPRWTVRKLTAQHVAYAAAGLLHTR